MTKPLILGFDSWTEGSHNYERLGQALADRGFELELLHVGSWGHDMDVPPSFERGGIQIYDIKTCAGRNFIDILKSKKPAAVLFLSTRSLAHQAMIVAAGHLGIPTIHLYHGVVSVQAGVEKPDAYKVNHWAHFKIVVSAIEKNLFTMRRPGHCSDDLTQYFRLLINDMGCLARKLFRNRAFCLR